MLWRSGSGSWGQQYVFDPFGNLLQKNITAGSPPSLSQAVNSYNQIVGQSYDANGNTLSTYNNGLTYGLGYDAENRLTATWVTSYNAQFVDYAYDAQNRRIWIWPGTEDTGGNMINHTVNFYTPSGQKLGAYTLTPGFVYQNGVYTAALDVVATSNDQYFGSRRLATLDRLGSAGRQGIWEGTYYPWGEDKGGTSPQDTWNYATYWRDSVSGLDYANNRYYSNSYGRFMTPDPFSGSADPNNPQSWNRYGYVTGDPVNGTDSSGLSNDGSSCDGFSDGYTGCYASNAGGWSAGSALLQNQTSLGPTQCQVCGAYSSPFQASNGAFYSTGTNASWVAPAPPPSATQVAGNQIYNAYQLACQYATNPCTGNDPVNVQQRGGTYNVQLPGNPLDLTAAQGGVADPLNLLGSNNPWHSTDSYYTGTVGDLFGADEGHVVNGPGGIEAHYDSWGPFNPLHWLTESWAGLVSQGPSQQYQCSANGCLQR